MSHGFGSLNGRPRGRLIFLILSLAAGLLFLTAYLPQTRAEEPLPVTSGAHAEVTYLQKIDPAILKTLESQETADFFIWLSEKADLSQAEALLTKEEKGQFVFNALRSTAASSQQSVRSFLDSQGISYRAFYISNKIFIRGGSQSLLTSLAARGDIARITPNQTYQLPKPFVNPRAPQQVLTIEPNISFINADDVWDMGFRGAGVVLAGNDTGLDWDHPALINQYRGWNGATADHNYNWWDATGTYPNAPNDGGAHGTHTTGTMVGDDGGTNQIGVAPDAQTIHCKNMTDSGSGDDFTFSECFEWDLAPWDLNGQNPRPDLAPDAVNNSWGYWGGNYPAFGDEIAALQAAGILVEVSAGNEGPSCGTLRSPGDYAEVLTTGSINHESGPMPGSLTWFSSRGPSLLTAEAVPDVMAPGENIRSSVPGGGYEGGWSGTSMAGPHVTGLIGLMWSANPGLQGLVPETIQIIAQTAVPLTGQTGSNCGGDYDAGPNNDWGYGTIDALAAVNAAILYGDPGVLNGAVSDSATTEPLEGVTVRAQLSPDLGWTRVTDAGGLYSMVVFSGTYTVTGSLYGYYPETVTGVQVLSFVTTTQNLVLDPAPFYTVSGVVTDATTGWPLYAQIMIDGYPGAPVWTDPETGQYTVSLAAGVPYTFRVQSWSSGYETAVRSIAPLTGSQTEDFALVADTLACAAPGYQPEFVYFEDFEASDGGYVPEGSPTSWAWGVPASGPGVAYSGSNVWATNLNGNYADGEFGYAASADIDLSAYTGQSLVLSWWQWLQTEQDFDYAFVEVSGDGGATWATVYGWISGSINTAWSKQSVMLDSSYATGSFRVRFGLSSDFSITYPGFYVDDVGIGLLDMSNRLYAQDFEADDGSFLATGTNSSWAWGVPTRGPGSAHSGDYAWATSLDDNYNNNETSSLTSPDIDLSAAAGKELILTWWQWLQSELNYDVAAVEVSNDGGGTWTTMIGPWSGPVDWGWNQYALWLDASYAVSNFRIRFTFSSDSIVTYPGWYVDDLIIDIYSTAPPAVPCEVLSGGLVVGNVLDANTGDGLNGAAVEHGATGQTAVTQPTPQDTAVPDGFYVLFSPAGSQSLTASKSRYLSDTQSVPVSLGQTVQQDFSLGAGLLNAAPASLAATLNMGEQTTLTLSLENEGVLDAVFELRERNLGMMPARFVSTLGDRRTLSGSTATAPTGYQPMPAALGSANLLQDDGLVCVFKDANPWGTQDTENFLAANGIAYAVYGSADFATLDFSTCQMIVISGDQPQSFYDAYAAHTTTFEEYVDNGGFLNFFAADNGWNFGILWAPLPGGMLWNGRYEDSNIIDDPTHPVVQGVPNPFTGFFASHGNFSNRPADSFIIAHEAAGGQPTIVGYGIGQGWVMAFGQPLEVAHSWGWELGRILENTLLWGHSYAPPDAPWLSVSPITGTVAAGNGLTLTVTLDAGVPEIVQPGNYLAELRIADDTPYQLANVPVVMSVNAPDSWGKVAGTIAGLAQCDQPDAPLNKADVEIVGQTTLQTAADGSYGYWLPAGAYTVTVSHEGYVQETAVLTLLAGETTLHNLELRRDQPCVSSTPDEISMTLGMGKTASTLLTLENTGAGMLTYAALETSYNFNPPLATLRTPREAAPLFSPAAAGGPLSVQANAGLAQAAGVLAPESAWYGAADVPNGIVRYAHAQCAEEPESFYVISGVDDGFNISTKAWRFSAADNAWTELAPIPAGQEGATAICYQGRIYVMGGGGSSQFFIYDIASDAWAAGAPLPRGVWGAAAAAWDGQVFLVGGDGDFFIGGTSAEVNVYDIASDSWTGNGTPMPEAAVAAGYVQAGPFLYVVGGWTDNSPGANAASAQRYDLTSNTWESGPTLAEPRSDFALAMTSEALYAIGGDADGGGFFDASKHVERLALADWAGGPWETTIDQLPAATSANNAGFCTSGFFAAQVYSVGGAVNGAISGNNRFLGRAQETCFSIYEDVPWITVTPASGAVGGDTAGEVQVMLDARQLDPGTYTATLVLVTNDATMAQKRVSVTLNVTGNILRVVVWTSESQRKVVFGGPIVRKPHIIN